jgi:hypothetical protein
VTCLEGLKEGLNAIDVSVAVFPGDSIQLGLKCSAIVVGAASGCAISVPSAPAPANPYPYPRAFATTG